MQFTPLQSRLAASLLASFALILIYFSLFSPKFALAQEISPVRPPPQGDDELGTVPDHTGAHDEALRASARSAVEYEPDFALFDRSIIGRAPPGVTALVNNVPSQLNLEPGTSKVFVFEKSSISGREQRIELRRDLGGTQEEPSDQTDSASGSAGEERTEDGRRGVEKRQQATRTVYISANTCMQPQPRSDATTMDAPQLTMYVSLVNPGPNGVAPGSEGDRGTWHVFDEGAVMANISSSQDVFIQLTAPTVRDDAFSGIYNFEVAASVDTSYHAYDDRSSSSSPSSSSPDLRWVDSDDSDAILTTRDLTLAPGDDQQRPFVVFANRVADRTISGVRYSFCGLQNYAQIAGIKDGKNSSLVRTSVATGGQGGMSRQQFHLSGLQAGTNYSSILARATRTNSPGGGGLVFRATNFSTRQADQASSCMLLSGLDFCTKVNYAVPANRAKFNATQLANFYDTHAKQYYDNFQKALSQVQCETDSTQIYSLARNCDDCRQAYKDWLCAVSIPRCEDFSSTKDYLQPRNIKSSFPDGRNLSDADLAFIPPEHREKRAVTSSRNKKIDQEVQPGPYKELLPCDYLCFDLPQSCPSKLQFRCPTSKSRHGYLDSYRPNETDAAGALKCNAPDDTHFARVWRGAAGPSAAASLSRLLLYGAATILGLALM